MSGHSRFDRGQTGQKFGLIHGMRADQLGKFQYIQSLPHRTVLRAYHPEFRLWHGHRNLETMCGSCFERSRKPRPWKEHTT